MSDSPFHDVGSVFPGEVNVVSVPSHTSVEVALRLMQEKRFSQLPVMEDGQVIGVFSLWSLTENLVSAPGMKIEALLKDLQVGDLMEQLPRVTVNESIHSILGHLGRYEAVLVNSSHGLQGVATSTDVLRYFYQVARPYILLQEVELALRNLIERCAPDLTLKQCIDRALVKSYEAKQRVAPKNLTEMSFEDYRTIIICSSNWPIFEGLLGKNREMVAAKLERLRRIRNDVFHFRNDVSLSDHQHLATSRDWLLGKLKSRVQCEKEQSHA